MKKMISGKEEKALKELLSLAPIPDASFDYYGLRGFLYGIAITPDVIQPDEWLPLVFGTEMPTYSDHQQASELTTTLFTVLNRHIAAFNDQTLLPPFAPESISEEDFDNIFSWTTGFEEALSLRPECWDEYQGLSDDEHDLLMNSLVVVEGVVYPEDAADMFDHLPKKELMQMGINLSGNEIEKIAQIQYFMLQALHLAVETIQKHAFRLEERRKEELRFSSIPFQKRSSYIDKNIDCPCGSGRSFGECCSTETQSVGRMGPAEKKAKIINVDFTQKGRDAGRPSKKKPVLQDHRCYRLEIALQEVSPRIWRIVDVPPAFSLAHLHSLIQVVMGWQDRHLHRFSFGTRLFGTTKDRQADMRSVEETSLMLRELEKELQQGLHYIYDFGDNWEHLISLEKIDPPGDLTPLPRVLAGSRACPPEDIGGAAMYMAFLEYLEGNHKLREHFEPLTPIDYDPDFFDVQSLNRRLHILYENE